MTLSGFIVAIFFGIFVGIMTVATVGIDTNAVWISSTMSATVTAGVICTLGRG